MGTAFGDEAAVDDGERALGVGAVDRGGEREVRPQAVVARTVVELVRDPHEPFAGPQLEDGARRVTASVAFRAFRARHVVAHRERGPGVVGLDAEPGPHRSGFDRTDADAIGRVDDAVDRGR